MPKSETGFDAETIALRLLARREHSRAELGIKLQQRGIDEDEAETVLDRLESEGALSEARFVEQLVRARLHQGYGPLRIHRDLAAKGVDPGLADAEMPFDGEAWAARAEAARRRHFGPELPRDQAERARQARFLERRGYAAAHIARVLRGEAADFDDN